MNEITLAKSHIAQENNNLEHDIDMFKKEVDNKETEI